jgi:hypothetical protein
MFLDELDLRFATDAAPLAAELAHELSADAPRTADLVLVAVTVAA